MIAYALRAVLPAWFAALLAVTTAIALPEAPSFKPALKPVVEVAFVLDTTGSMGPLIEGAKRRSGRSPPPSSTPTRTRISAWGSSPMSR